MKIEHHSTDEKHSHYIGMRFRITVIIVLVSLIPMALVSGTILYQFHVYSNKMVHAHLGEMVLKHRQSIDNFLTQKLNDINHLSKTFNVSELRDTEFLQRRLRALQEDYGFVFVDLGVIDKNGIQVSYAGPYELQMVDYSESEWFKHAIKAETYISDVFLGMRGHPHFIVTVKRWCEDCEWLLRATIDFFAFNTLVEDFMMGKTGTAFILNRQGEFQTRSPKGELKLARQQYMNLFKKGEDSLNLFRQGSMIDPTIQSNMAYPRSGYMDENLQKSSIFSVSKMGDQGRKFIIVAAFLKNNDWLLIFQQEAKDAFAKLHNTQKIAGLISFAGALIIIIVASFVSGKMVKRIVKLDSEKEIMNQQVIQTGKLASIGELAAGIAHEINNPVAIMVEEAGWIQDLLNEGIDNKDNLEEFKRALEQIDIQGHRCKEITHKLLSFARKTDSRIQTMQINDFIPEVVDLLSQKSRYANIDVSTKLQPGLPTIQASSTEMQQVLMNILQNAVYVMEKTGGKILITTQASTDDIRIAIADNGPGIPASNIERIFDPFFTTKPVGKGTGLGLSICYGIIQKMGGSIEVESQVNKGTTFTIVLPLNA